MGLHVPFLKIMRSSYSFFFFPFPIQFPNSILRNSIILDAKLLEINCPRQPVNQKINYLHPHSRRKEEKKFA